MDIRIYYEDTDSGGVVYYANYLRYFERSRTELLKSVGINIAELINDGLFFVVTHAEIDYKLPAEYGDLISVKAIVSWVKKASFEVRYEIVRQPDSKLIVLGKTTMALLNTDRHPTKMSEEMLEKLKTLGKPAADPMLPFIH